MRYQVGSDGDPLCCTKCGEWLRSSPVYDTWPVCARKRCKNAEALGAAVLDAVSGVFGPPDQGDVITGGERIVREKGEL